MTAQQTPTHWQHKSRVARDFGAAAGHYDRAARLQREVVDALMTLQPQGTPATLLDLGCGTGLALPQLSERYPDADLYAMDLAEGMVAYTENRFRDSIALATVADAEALPLQRNSVDRVFSSLMIQWCPAPSRVLSEVARVLRPGGTALVSTLLDGTLSELKESWEAVDPAGHHVNRFISRTSLERLCAAAFDDVQTDYRRVTLEYDNVLSLFRELKGLGARYKADDRSASVTGPGKIRALQSVYEQAYGQQGRIPARYEVALIRLTKPA